MGLYRDRRGRMHRTVDGTPWDRRAAKRMTRVDSPGDRPLDDHTVDELRQIAGRFEIDGAASMRKAELVDAIGRAAGAAAPEGESG